MLDADRAAQLTDQLLKVIMSELEREPRTPDNVWYVLDAVACVVAGLIKVSHDLGRLPTVAGATMNGEVAPIADLAILAPNGEFVTDAATPSPPQ